MTRHDARIISISLSRSTAPVEVREQLAYQDWSALLSAYSVALREWAILSTCHRFELYMAVSPFDADAVVVRLQEMLTSVISAISEETASYSDARWRIRIDEGAVEHLCRVAAGLDSLVLGEAQIQGQVIATYTKALELGTIGPVLSLLFRTAIRVGKRARTETMISTRAVSMSSVALSMAAHHVENITSARILVIGAGEMSRLALKVLLQRHAQNVTIANRTPARAEAALMHPRWQVKTLDAALDSLGQYDIVFSATSAPNLVITRHHLEYQSAVRPGENSAYNKKQIFIDLAVPRDVDPELRNAPDIILVDVDDLQHGLDQSLASRMGETPAVETIICTELDQWHAAMRELSMRPYVVELRQRAELIRQREVDRTLRFIGDVDEETRTHIQHLSRALVNKLLHEPTVRIKELAHHEEADHYASAICNLFGLEPGPSAALGIEHASQVVDSPTGNGRDNHV